MNTKVIKTAFAILLGFFLLTQSTYVFTQAAETPKPVESFKVTEILKAPGQAALEGEVPSITAFILKIINFLTLTIGTVAFVALIFGGLVFITSHGNEQQVTRGKDIMKYSIIGLIVVFASFIITTFVQSLFI